MHNLKNDYSILAHPLVLEALSAAAASGSFESYGNDGYSKRAAGIIKDIINAPNAGIHFTCGGTQTNLLAACSALRPHEALIAAKSAHPCVHETGAIEATGHKICTAGAQNGKLQPEDIEAIVHEHGDEHMALPRLVFISQSAETGTVYTKEELTAISEVCKKHRLYLYIDGARLGAALASPACDLTYADIASLADVFYIGGTKNGALFGEALVIVNDALKADFRYIMKQRGALISKGAAIGIQFEALFKDGLYDRLAAHAVSMGLKLAGGIEKAGYSFKCPAATNLLLPVFPAALVQTLRKSFEFYDWERDGDMITARLVTSWSTPEEAVDEFVEILTTK